MEKEIRESKNYHYLSTIDKNILSLIGKKIEELNNLYALLVDKKDEETL